MPEIIGDVLHDGGDITATEGSVDLLHDLHVRLRREWPPGTWCLSDPIIVTSDSTSDPAFEQYSPPPGACVRYANPSRARSPIGQTVERRVPAATRSLPGWGIPDIGNGSSRASGRIQQTLGKRAMRVRFTETDPLDIPNGRCLTASDSARSPHFPEVCSHAT